MDNMTLQQFIDMYSGKWFEGGECSKCFHPYHDPLKNFTDCYVDLGITGDEELTKTCEEYQEIVQKLWGLIHKHDFEYKEVDERMSGDRAELCCPACGAPQNELDDVPVHTLEYDCSHCNIRFKISVKHTYDVVDIKSI